MAISITYTVVSPADREGSRIKQIKTIKSTIPGLGFKAAKQIADAALAVAPVPVEFVVRMDESTALDALIAGRQQEGQCRPWSAPRIVDVKRDYRLIFDIEADHQQV